MRRERVTVEMVRDSYPEEYLENDRKLGVAKMISRYSSFYFTPFFLNWNISANAVSFIGLFFGILGSLLLAVPDKFLAEAISFWSEFSIFSIHNILVLGSIFILFWDILDHVDGNVARFNKTSSNFGTFIDFITDVPVWCFIIFPCLGTGLWLRTDNINFLLMGFIFAFLCGLRLFFHFQTISIVRGRSQRTKKEKLEERPIPFRNKILLDVFLGPLGIVTITIVNIEEIYLLFFIGTLIELIISVVIISIETINKLGFRIFDIRLTFRFLKEYIETFK